MCILDGEDAVISPVLVNKALCSSREISLLISVILSPVVMVAYCSEVSRASNSSSTSCGLRPRFSCVTVPFNILSTISLSPYGPIALARGHIAKGDVLDILSFFVLRSANNW